MAIALLSLPGEIRNTIYALLVISDLEALAETMTKPLLLRTSHQLRKEYSDVFFSYSTLQIDAYHGLRNTWTTLQQPQAKRKVFEQCVLTDLLHFWSLASARRYCQRVYSDYQGGIETGIMTVRASDGIKRWQWSMPLAD